MTTTNSLPDVKLFDADGNHVATLPRQFQLPLSKHLNNGKPTYFATAPALPSLPDAFISGIGKKILDSLSDGVPPKAYKGEHPKTAPDAYLAFWTDRFQAGQWNDRNTGPRVDAKTRWFNETISKRVNASMAKAGIAGDAPGAVDEFKRRAAALRADPAYMARLESAWEAVAALMTDDDDSDC